MRRLQYTYRRGISTAVGAMIAVAAMIALAVIVTQALDERARLAEERLERAREDLAVIPVVNSTGVYAEIINRGYVDTVIKHILVVNRSSGQIIYHAAPRLHIEPGNATVLRLGGWSSGRLDIAVVTQRGSVFRWDPELTIDGILDLPGEPAEVEGLENMYLHPALAGCRVSRVETIKVNASIPPGSVDASVHAGPGQQNLIYSFSVGINGDRIYKTWVTGGVWPRFPIEMQEVEPAEGAEGIALGLYARVYYEGGDFIATAEAAILLNITNITQPVAVVSDALYTPIPPSGTGLGYIYIIEPPGGLAPIASNRDEARLPLSDLLGALSTVTASATPPREAGATILMLNCG